VQRFLDIQAQEPPQEAAEAELLDEIRDHDDYGLAAWHFLRAGENDPPFSRLRQERPAVWRRIQRAVTE
jgi:hypothetical protein